jgi:cullin-associated NEDD8-dissociated protein 1
VTAELPQEGKLPEKACAKLAPKLLAQVEKLTTPPETVIEMLSILSILVSRFPVYLADVYPSPIVTLTPLLTHPRIAVRKRAVFALAQFLPTASEQTFEKLLKSTILPALMSNVSLEHQRTIILLLGAIARFAPQQIGPVLGVVVLPVLSAASRDDVELREVCLQVGIMDVRFFFVWLNIDC